MKIGLFGGTFDPIHYGHIFMASYILEYMNFDKIVFIPSGIAPHKSEVLDKKHRKNMLQLSIKDNDKFEIDTFEVDRECTSYTYETLRHICQNNKRDDFYYIIGQDAYLYIDKWYKFEEVIDMVKFVIVTRKYEENLNLKVYDENKHFLINTPNIEISSTDIRNRVRNKKSIKYFVKEDVEKYILEHNIYL